MSLVLVTPPATEPVTIAEVAAHLRLDDTNQEPAPDAPLVAMASPAAAGNVTAGAHRYQVVFVTAAGKTQGGAMSAAVMVADAAVNGKVTLTAIPLGGSAVTARELYRTAAGGTLSMLLATINDNTTTTYTDNIADGALGAGAPVTNTTDDPLLTMLITSARVAAETITRRALVTQTWDLKLERFPGWEMTIPLPTLQSVTSISYVDTNGATQTMSAADYLVDSSGEPGRIAPAFGLVWPVTRWQMNAVTVRFVAGYGAASAIPSGIKNWMLMRIKTLWENRAELVVDTRTMMVVLPAAFVDGLLDPYRVEDFSWAVS